MKQGKRDLKGNCPGWWRTQPYVLDVLYFSKHRDLLEHPNHMPNRLAQSLTYLDSFETEAAMTRLKSKESKNVS